MFKSDELTDTVQQLIALMSDIADRVIMEPTAKLALQEVGRKAAHKALELAQHLIAESLQRACAVHQPGKSALALRDLSHAQEQLSLALRALALEAEVREKLDSLPERST
jgi:hypothetical protein